MSKAKEGGRYYLGHKKAKNHKIFSNVFSTVQKTKSRQGRRKPIENYKEKKKLKIEKIFQRFSK